MGGQFYLIGPVANSGLIGLLDARPLMGLLLLSDARLLLFVVRHCREVLSGEVLGRNAN